MHESCLGHTLVSVVKVILCDMTNYDTLPLSKRGVHPPPLPYKSICMCHTFFLNVKNYFSAHSRYLRYPPHLGHINYNLHTPLRVLFILAWVYPSPEEPQAKRWRAVITVYTPPLSVAQGHKNI